MRRPSVLLINRVYPPGRGATGRILKDLARSFAREGWQVYVLTTGHKSMRELDGAVKVIRIKASEKPSFIFGYPLILFKFFWMALRVPKTHLVVSMTDPPFTIAVGTFAAWRMKARHIHWCQDLYPDVFKALGIKIPGFIEKMLSKLTVFCMKRADKIIVIGHCMAKHLKNKGVLPKKITIIPNWPDEELTHLAVQKTEFRKAVKKSENIEGIKPFAEQYKSGQKFRILYAGNIGLAHPLNSALEVAKALDESNPEIEFVFVGEGPRFDKISKFRSDHSLNNIRLLPYQPNSKLREVMESGDLHLISMRDEAAGCLVPSKLYSALAVARPSIFIGPKNCEVAKVLHDYDAGKIVAANEQKALQEAILLYRYDGQAWFSGHEGAQKASEVFQPHEAMQAWLKRAKMIVIQDLKGKK